ncbi:MAG: hypothetical protein P1U68_04785 [Verrucomicrobiales bacterium]|nr:hypothetical protein [Verrucomicrobiales bacterium]
MQNHFPTKSRKKCRGYGTFVLVATISLVMLTLLTLNLINSLKSMDMQKTAQVKQDYTQRENAILNALIHIVPNKAIGAMQRDSSNSSDTFTWETIFDEALDLANAEQAVDPQLLTSLDITSAISANTGDATISDIDALVSRPSDSPLSGDSIVNGGNFWETTMLFDSDFYSHIPAPLTLSTQNNAKKDRTYPIISFDKTHVPNDDGSLDPVYHKGLGVSADLYPLYNQLTYPDVKFGYKRPGDLFVGKRNWWVFSLTFGKDEAELTGVPPVTRNYLLSIYEIPSQLPLSSTNTMTVGEYEDGTSWDDVSITGSLYSHRLKTEGDVVVDSGALSARDWVEVSSQTTVDGNTLDNSFDALGTRETLSAAGANDFYGASVAGNVGKVAFIPINRGNNFLWPGGNDSNCISPTGWQYYSRGANQCTMRIEMRRMNSSSDQTPEQVRFHYKDSNGTTTRRVTYTRGSNWPTEFESGGDRFPFQTEIMANSRMALVYYPDRMPDFLDDLGNAADVSVNNSIVIYPNTGRATVEAPSIPAEDDDLVVSLKGCKDLTDYTNGFSLLTRYRLYIADSFNATSTTPPANSGLPVGDEYFPPASLFSPEKRFGDSPLAEQTVKITGQLSSLKTSNNNEYHPLELQMADDSAVTSERIQADLVDLTSPAELPPIHMMNWLVTIEPIR